MPRASFNFERTPTGDSLKDITIGLNAVLQATRMKEATSARDQAYISWAGRWQETHKRHLAGCSQPSRGATGMRCGSTGWGAALQCHFHDEAQLVHKGRCIN